MKGILGGFAAGLLATLALLAVADDRKAPPADKNPPKEMTLEGEIIDLTSYLIDGSHGKDHWKMAKAHVKNGTPAAMLTFDGKLFVITPYNRDGFAPLNNAGEIVRIRGTVYERDGVSCVIAKECKQLPPGYDPEGGDGGGDARRGGDPKAAPKAGVGVGGAK